MSLLNFLDLEKVIRIPFLRPGVRMPILGPSSESIRITSSRVTGRFVI